MASSPAAKATTEGAPNAPTPPPKGVNVAHWKEDLAHNDWCPGCGDFGVLNAVQMALAETGRENHEVAVFSGSATLSAPTASTRSTAASCPSRRVPNSPTPN
jgi:hypothetical protein